MSARARLLAALAAVAAAVTVAAAPAAASGDGMRPGIWLTPAEVRQLPENGPAWAQVLDWADEDMGHADLSDQNENHDIHVLAAALAYARTGEDRFRRKVAAGVSDAVGTEHGGRTLSLARGLVAYVVAADLIDLHDYDPGKDRRFRDWLATVRTERLEPSDNPTLIATHELRPNNWGTHAGASRIAADVYLGDRRDLARAAAVFKGWLGDRSVYHGFRYGDSSWQADPKAPVGVDPPGAVKDGHSIDGALPDDMRRGCSLRFPPCPTLYPWEAMQGAVVQAELLSRQGYDAWNWGDQALRRAATFLFDLHSRYGEKDWAAPAGDAWIPWLLNARYGTHFPAETPADPGKGMGFTDWTAAGGCGGGDGCGAPSGPPQHVRPVTGPIPGPQPAGGGDADVPALAVLGGVALLALALALAAGRRGSRVSRRRARRARPRA
jgi:alginate lyase